MLKVDRIYNDNTEYVKVVRIKGKRKSSFNQEEIWNGKKNMTVSIVRAENKEQEDKEDAGEKQEEEQGQAMEDDEQEEAVQEKHKKA